LIVQEVLGVVYSPVKTFKEIVKNPSIKGPLIIFLLILLVTAGAQYVSASKLSLEIGTPEEDDWTESKALWTPEGVSTDGADKFVGNYSVTSSVINDTSVWMRITGMGSFNCSADKGYGGLSFRIKWIHQNEIPPANATLRLFSNSNRYFELDVGDRIANSSDAWGNVTVNVGPTNLDWLPSVDPPDWGNITALEFELAWLPTYAANLTIKIDDLYFGKHVAFLITDRFSGWFVESLTVAAFNFFLAWSLYAALLVVTAKLSRSEAGPWKVLFIVIGYTFSIRIVHLLVDALLVSTLPPLVFPLRAWNPIAGEEKLASKLIDDIYQTSWYPTLSYNLSFGFVFVVHAWTMALFTIAVHFLREFPWKKAASISITAYVLYILVRSFLAI